MLVSAGTTAWISGIGLSGYLAANILVFILAAFFLVPASLIYGFLFREKKSFSRSLTPCLKILIFLTIIVLSACYYQGYVSALFEKANAFASEPPDKLRGVVVSEAKNYNGTAYFTLKEENGLKISVKVRTDVPILCGQRVCLYEPTLLSVNPANSHIQATRKMLGNNTFLSATFPYNATVKTEGIGSYPLYLGKQLRLATADCLQGLFRSEVASFLTALISSDRSEMAEELYEDFLSTGTVHIVVVSGMHFNYLMAALMFLLCFLFPSRRKRMVLSILILVAFVGYTGATLPVLRSFLMMSVSFLCDFFYLKPHKKYITVLLLSSIFLLITPTLIFNPSFLLSFGASFGLTALGQGIEEKLKWLPWSGLRSYLATCSSVWIMTLPVLLLYFGKMPLISVITNFLVAPLVAPILILCIITLAVHKIPLISSLVIFLEQCLSNLFLWLIKLTSSATFSLRLCLRDSTFVGLMAAAACVALSAQAPRKSLKYALKTVAVLCVACAIFLQTYVTPSPRMLVTFFGATNTNSAAIVTPSHHFILYGDAKDLIYGQSSAAYRPYQPIDLMILTNLSDGDSLSEFFKTHPAEKIILPEKFRNILPNRPNIQGICAPVTITLDGVRISLNTDGESILEAEFVYANQPISFTQNAQYLLEHLEQNPQKNWVFNFRRTSGAATDLTQKTVRKKLFSKKSWHPDVTLYNNYSMIQADAGGVRLLHSAEQEP